MIKRYFLLVAILSISSSVFTDIKFTCKEDEDESKKAFLTFSNDEDLKKVVIVNVPFKDVPRRLTLLGEDAEASTGSNSSEKYKYYQWTREYNDFSFDFDLSYRTHLNRNKITLDESLVGQNVSTHGVVYGKLRIDVVMPDFDDPDNPYAGTTLRYQCVRKKQKRR